MKILILNPPSLKRHLRGNYCSNVSKGAYYYPAIDLLVQSGILANHFPIVVCDAIAESLSREELFRLASQGVTGVLAVTGSSSGREDFEFFAELKNRLPRLRLLIMGGFLLTRHRAVLLEQAAVDGVLTDWTSEESVRFFRGENGPFSCIATRDHPLSASGAAPKRQISYPTPKHELFPLRRYHHPNARRHPFSVVIHSYGCPYTCDYCIYSITPYRARPPSEVIEELKYLKAIGVREVFFHDPTFSVKRSDGIELMNSMIAEKLGLSWFCQTRVDHMDEELLTLMRKAGCHAIMFGVETFNEELLREHERKLTHEETRKVYALCRKLGIRTLSYLVIGLPGDTEETLETTLEFVKKIGSDFVSFNLAIPVIGTKFRDKAIAEGLASDRLMEFDNSNPIPTMGTRQLSQDRLQEIHRKMVRSFYLRPSYLLKRLVSVRSGYELANQVREGLAVLGNQFR